MSTRYMHPQRWVRRLEGWEENSTPCIDIGLVSCLSRVPITATSGSARPDRPALRQLRKGALQPVRHFHEEPGILVRLV